jgi:hypothetical protein
MNASRRANNYSAVNISLFFLQQYASSSGWSGYRQGAVSILGLIGPTFFVIWFTVSMWRAARRNFLLGQRFWPIVASLAAVFAAGAYVALFVVRYIDVFMRVR